MKKLINILLHSITVLVISVLILDTVFFDLVSRIKNECVISDYEENSEINTILAEETKSFYFSIEKGRFSFIDMKIEPEKSLLAQVNLTNLADATVYYSETLTDKSIIDSGEDKVIRLVSNELFPTGDYKLEITNLSDNLLGLEVQESNQEVPNIKVCRYSHVGIIMSIVVGILIIAHFLFFYAIVRRGKLTFEKYFLVTVIPFSLIFLLLFAPWNTPDSHSHFAASYRFSNIILGYEKENPWSGRMDDGILFTRVWGSELDSMYPSVKSYFLIAENINSSMDNSSIVDLPFRDEKMEYYSFINYFPQILGITIGRLLNLNLIVCMYLARFLILFFYICACYNAIKKTPIAKSLFTMIPLLPICLMMGSAFSYDPMVIAASLNFIANVLRLKMEPQNRKAWIETAIWIFIIGATKGGGYLLLLPLVFILLKKDDMKQAICKIISIAGSGLFSVLLFDKILQIGKTLFQFGEEGNGKMTADFAFVHPMEFLNMSITTYLSNLDMLVFGMLGRELSWSERTIPITIIILLCLPFMIIAICEKNQLVLRKNDRLLFMFVIGLTIVFTPMMLLSWTDLGSKTILGLQGRYYLPVLVPALILISDKLRHCVKNAESLVILNREKIMACFSVTLTLAVYFMERKYLLR